MEHPINKSSLEGLWSVVADPQRLFQSWTFRSTWMDPSLSKEMGVLPFG